MEVTDKMTKYDPQETTMTTATTTAAAAATVDDDHTLTVLNGSGGDGGLKNKRKPRKRNKMGKNQKHITSSVNDCCCPTIDSNSLSSDNRVQMNGDVLLNGQHDSANREFCLIHNCIERHETEDDDDNRNTILNGAHSIESEIEIDEKKSSNCVTTIEPKVTEHKSVVVVADEDEDDNDDEDEAEEETAQSSVEELCPLLLDKIKLDDSDVMTDCETTSTSISTTVSGPSEEHHNHHHQHHQLPIEEAAAMTDEELPKTKDIIIEYREYENELQMPDIMRLIQKDLSEPYSIYTYRYFIHNWPKLCFLAMHRDRCVGAIVCKLDIHRQVIKRGYIAMLAVDKNYRKLKIGTNLVQKAIQAMLQYNADEVVLETELTNTPALRLYENLGFVRDKRLFGYYLNGVDALRLKLWFR